MNYAIVENNIVVNIAVANEPLNENWIYVGELPVTFGDIYNNGNFFHEGEQVLTVLEQLQLKNEQYIEVLNILLGEED